VPVLPVRYRSADEDSARWTGFGFQAGDVVISTRSKSGTTWMQMICALLVLQTARLPRPLSELSPWLDWLGTPLADVHELLAAQQHRRFIKTHTPLDGIPLDPRATYIVVARHPLDMAVSLYHQGSNLDRDRMAELTGRVAADAAPAPRPALNDWLVAWTERDVAPADALDSLPGVLWHLSDAWSRRDANNVVLMHYDDLLADLEGQMRLLAGRLGIRVPEGSWPDLVAAATFDRMRDAAREAAPNPMGILKDPAAFFRRGRSGAGREVLSDDGLDRYHDRTAQLAPADLLAWLHRDQRR
jgi:aryl sulfotransferase